MAKANQNVMPFPINGYNSAAGYAGQLKGTTPLALNIWPRQPGTERARGGTRAGLVDGRAGEPTLLMGGALNSCIAEWSGGRGYAFTCKVGTFLTNDGIEFSRIITVRPDGPLASCVNYRDTIYQASSELSQVWYHTLGGTGFSVLTAPANRGVVPTNCGLVNTHQNRLVLAGDKNFPHALYMSAVDDATNWDYSAVHAGAAMANAGGGEGRVGEPITSLISHNRACLLVGCTDSLYIVRGNPRVGGSLETLSHQIGPLSQQAWCKTGSEDTVFMTREGLFIIPPGCGAIPEQISDNHVPDELRNLDITPGDYCSLAWDGRFGGVHITITERPMLDRPNLTSSFTPVKTKWWFFVPPSRNPSMPPSFWEMDSSSVVPVMNVALKSTASEERGGIVVHDIDGRAWHYSLEEPQSELITSTLAYGPIELSSAFDDGVLARVTATLAANSSNVNWEVRTGDSEEEAINSTAAFTGADWDRQGFNYWQHPRTRGRVAYIVISGTGLGRISVEEILAESYPKSRRRIM